MDAVFLKKSYFNVLLSKPIMLLGAVSYTHTFCKARDKLFYFYLLSCFTFSVKHLIFSLIIIIYVHIRHICIHVFTVLRCFKHYFHVYKCSSYLFMNLPVFVLLLFSNTVQG